MDWRTIATIPNEGADRSPPWPALRLRPLPRRAARRCAQLARASGARRESLTGRIAPGVPSGRRANGGPVAGAADIVGDSTVSDRAGRSRSSAPCAQSIEQADWLPVAEQRHRLIRGASEAEPALLLGHGRANVPAAQHAEGALGNSNPARAAAASIAGLGGVGVLNVDSPVEAGIARFRFALYRA